MTWTPTFRCPKDGREWQEEWTFGGEVTCPECSTVYETEYEVDYDDNVSGPWLGAEVKPHA